MSATTTLTREQWLHQVAELLWPKVIAQGGKKPDSYRVSCGWPARNALRTASRSNRRIGECWVAGSEDKTREIFISPALDNPVEVADVLLHELIHAALPEGVGHKHPFPSIAKRLGLQGKPTSTFAGPELVEELTKITDGVGKYPHAKLDASVKPKQKARQMKCQCPDCGYVIRVARSWIDVGTPTCVCGTKMESIEYTDGEGLAREPLTLRESFSSYITEDGRFELSTTKRTGREGLWNVTEVETARLQICRNREDALAFIAAVRAGETDFPELETDADNQWADDEWRAEDDYLADDEVEVPDFDDIEIDPEHDEYPAHECPGHPADEFSPMGETQYCDGSCLS